MSSTEAAGTEPWTRLTEEAAQLAATFGKRRAGAGEHDRTGAGAYAGGREADSARVDENLAELTAALGPDLGNATGTLVRTCALLRVVAGGCGPTAFALAARLASTGEYGGGVSSVSGKAARLSDHAEAAVLLGLAERAYALALADLKERSALKGRSTGAEQTAPPALLPGTQFAVARMRAALAATTALLEHCARAEDADGQHTTRADSSVPRVQAAAAAEQVVSAAYEQVRGHGGEAERSIARIWQDLKTGPRTRTDSPDAYDADTAAELIGKAAFGIDPAETPRWL
jgi:hypothetical protein